MGSQSGGTDLRVVRANVRKGRCRNMRLERMNIQGFGAVRDKSLEIDAPVTVLYGPNEGEERPVFYPSHAVRIPGKGSPAERGEPSEEGIHGGGAVSG